MRSSFWSRDDAIQRHEPTVTMRVRVGEDERIRHRDAVKVCAIVGLFDVAVNHFEAVIRVDGVVAA
jgi:hypothetical protein